MRILVALVAAVLVGGSATFAVAQHQHSHDMSAPSAPDARQFVKFPAALVEETLANMRDHFRPYRISNCTSAWVIRTLLPRSLNHGLECHR